MKSEAEARTNEDGFKHMRLYQLTKDKCKASSYVNLPDDFVIEKPPQRASVKLASNAFFDLPFEERILSLDSAYPRYGYESSIDNRLLKVPRSGKLLTVRKNRITPAISCPSLTAPTVVVSDHSSTHSSSADSKCDISQAAVTSNNYLALAIRHLLTSDPDKSALRFQRRFSCASSYSSNSSVTTLSLDDQDSTYWSSDNIFIQTPIKEPSAWKKVRNIVHWSPFVQTYKKQKYPWVQLAGHQGNFKPGGQGTILKKLNGEEEVCLKQLMNDPLKEFVPELKGKRNNDDEVFLELEDLLADFECPNVMDIKMGVRTYLEDELAKAREKPKLRKDMYDKMIQIDPSEPTDEENRLKAVTKPRYMIWRETISSTACLGFRIEGIKYSDGVSTKDFKTLKDEDQLEAAFLKFMDKNKHICEKYLQRLRCLSNALEVSTFFQSHELIGSSLLFVHDNKNANVWMIDFAKTFKVPDNVKITHKNVWAIGNHEDGYLIGLDNLIRLFEHISSTEFHK